MAERFALKLRTGYLVVVKAPEKWRTRF